MDESKAVIVSKIDAQIARNCMEGGGILDKSKRLQTMPDGNIAIPITDMKRCSFDTQELHSEADIIKSLLRTITHHVQRVTIFPTKKCKLQSPYQQMLSGLKSCLQQRGLWDERLLPDIPKHWEIHGDFVIFSAHYFQHEVWQELGDVLWRTIASVLQVNRVALRSKISTDCVRSPEIHIAFGDSPIVRRTELGIKYAYDITKCMFSVGNVSEKQRIGRLDCRDEVVVDMYAGIGYFTLPYLLHAGAKHVHACEWNPAAVAALHDNLRRNYATESCTVHDGDNRVSCPRNVADRVNLGLIPSSEAGWETACRALPETQGGILHVHGNINTKHGSRLAGHLLQERGSDKTQQTARRHATSIDDCRQTERPSVTACDIQLGESNDESVDSRGVDDAQAAKRKWAEWVRGEIHAILQTMHPSRRWTVRVFQITHVKTYAPHISHMVVDLDCRPSVNQ